MTDAERAACCVAFAYLLALADPATAQPATAVAPVPASSTAPDPAAPPLAAFLERRVPEELASEGLLLSRSELRLALEQLGPRWRISLIDLTTGQVAASIRIDQLPNDREAAVAIVTHLAADLASELLGRPAPPSAAHPVAAAPPPAQAEAPAPAPPAVRSPAELERAQRTFERVAIRFGTSYDLEGSLAAPKLTRHWQLFQGAPQRHLAADEFYREVGRPDLAASYQRRRNLAFAGSLVAGSAVIGTLSYLLYETNASSCGGDGSATQCGSPSPVGWIALGVSALGLGVGLWVYYHPEPIDERDAKQLAEAYNRRLRRLLRLPEASRLRPLRDVVIAPYVGAGRGSATGATGGLAVTGRF